MNIWLKSRICPYYFYNLLYFICKKLIFNIMKANHTQVDNGLDLFNMMQDADNKSDSKDNHAKMVNYRSNTSFDEETVENWRKMLISISHDIRIILIKLSDRTHNMKTLDALPPKRQLEKEINLKEKRGRFAEIAPLSIIAKIYLLCLTQINLLVS